MSAISKRGLRNPTVVTLYHLASVLGVSHVELVTDDEARREAAKTQAQSRRNGNPEKRGADSGD